MRDPRHPRRFADEFKRQIVGLHDAGKLKREIMEEYDLGKSTVERWIKSAIKSCVSMASRLRGAPPSPHLLEPAAFHVPELNSN